MADTQETAKLCVHLLQTLQLFQDGSTNECFIPDKARGLIAYLATEQERAHRREFLAELLWPGKPEGMARNNLKQTLANTRQCLGDRENEKPYIFASRDELQWNPESDVWIDTFALDESLKTIEEHQHKTHIRCEICIAELTIIDDLYRGGFLEDFSLSDCPEFENWRLIQLEAYRRRVSRALRQLVYSLINTGDFHNAGKAARKLIEIEPWSEENSRLMMAALALSGRRSAALRQFDQCKAIMKAEFGVEPTKDTINLYEAIRDDQNESIPHQVAPGSVLAADLLEPGPASTEVGTPAPGRELERSRLPVWLLATFAGILIVMAFIFFEIPAVLLKNKRLVAPDPGEVIDDQVGIQENLLPLEAGTTPVQTVSLEQQERERQALVSLFEATSGEEWAVAEGWIEGETHCDWSGVICADNAVVELHLTQNGLSGPLPNTIGTLQNLEVLDLAENNLQGPLPSGLAEMDKLVLLDLASNDFEGPIPEELGELESLIHLVLIGNPRLNGEIPPELGNLQNLHTLGLSNFESGAQLEGTLPPELGNLKKLNYLEISNTLIQGHIPEEYGNMRDLIRLDLTNNRLSGEIPESFGNLVNIRDFRVGGGPNNLHGPLPLSLTNWTRIEFFMFAETDICEPLDRDFLLWLGDIPNVERTSVSCPLVD